MTSWAPRAAVAAETRIKFWVMHSSVILTAFTHRLLHTNAFTHRHFYTQTLLHTDTFAQPFVTKRLLHTEACTHRGFYTQELFTYTEFDTQTRLHTDTFTHRHFDTHKHFLHRDFYTQKLLHRRFYTQRRLHTNTDTHRDRTHGPMTSQFYLNFGDRTSFRAKGLRQMAIEPHFVRKGCAGHLQIAILHHFYKSQFYISFWRSNLISCEVATGTRKSLFYLSFWRSNLISCERVAPDALQIAILHQFLAIEPHFVWKGCGGRFANRNFRSVFGDRTSFRAKGLRRTLTNRNFTSVFGDRTSFRVKGCAGHLQIAILHQFLAIEPHFVRKGYISWRLVGTAPRRQERNRKEGGSKMAREQEGKRARENVKMWWWEDVKMHRCEDVRMWRWEDGKICEDEKMWRWEDVSQTPTIRRTLRSDALGKKDDFEAFFKRTFERKITSTKIAQSAHKSLSQPWCSHSNTILELQLQKTIVLRMQPWYHATLTQPLQCVSHHAHRNNHSVQNTEEEPIASGTTPAAHTRYLSPPAATTLHGKMQGFVLRLPPQHKPHATFMQPLPCVSPHMQTCAYLRTWQHQMTTINQLFHWDLQPQIQDTHIELSTQEQPPVTEHRGGTHRVRNDPSRTRRTHEVPFIAACNHFTRKNTRFRAPASSPTQAPCNIHAAITMRFAA